MTRAILVFFLFLALVFETSFFSFPFVLILSLILWIYYPDATTLVFVFIATLILDILRLMPIASSIIFLIISFILIDISRKSLDFSDVKSTMLVVFIGVFLYARFFSYFPSVIFYGLIFIVTFLIVEVFAKKYILN